MRSLTWVVFALAFVASALPAQPPVVPAWPVEAGSRVRILSPVLGKRYVTGSVVAATPDTLALRAATKSTSTAIATPTIIRLEIARGTHTNTARYAVGGFLVGALVGAAIGGATAKPACTNCLDYTQGATALGYGLLGGLVGGFAGATIGRRPTDTWVPVTLPAR
jgi:hypothetical protein